MKNKGYKAIILVVIASLIFGGLVLADFGRAGRGGRPGLGFGPQRFGGYGIRAQGPNFGRGMHGGYGMGVPKYFGIPMGPGRPGILSRPHEPGRAMVLMGILHRLGLSDEQNGKIKDIQNDNKAQMEAAAKAITEAAKALHETVAEGADEAAIRAAGTKLGEAVAEQAVLRATTITSIKKVLTDEQLTKLKEFQEKIKDRIGDRGLGFEPNIPGTGLPSQRLRQRGATGGMGPYQGWSRGREIPPMGRPDFERPFRGRGYRRGWEHNEGRTPGWKWPE